MARIVSTKKTRRPPAQPGGRENLVRTASMVVVALCAIFAAWRLATRGAATPTTAPAQPAPKATVPPPSQTGRAIAQTPADDADAPASGQVRPTGKQPPAGRRGGAVTENGEASKPEAPPPPVASNREREYFDNEIENTIASVSEPGAEFFGFPPGTDMEEDEILEYLRRPVEILEDDDDAAIEAKERTAEFKAQALKAIEEDGLTFNQFVRDLVALRNEQAAMREDAFQEMVKILRKDGEEAAREYISKINPELKEQGMKELIIPPLLLEDARRR